MGCGVGRTEDHGRTGDRVALAVADHRLHAVAVCPIRHRAVNQRRQCDGRNRTGHKGRVDIVGNATDGGDHIAGPRHSIGQGRRGDPVHTGGTDHRSDLRCGIGGAEDYRRTGNRVAAAVADHRLHAVAVCPIRHRTVNRCRQGDGIYCTGHKVGIDGLTNRVGYRRGFDCSGTYSQVGECIFCIAITVCHHWILCQNSTIPSIKCYRNTRY